MTELGNIEDSVVWGVVRGYIGGRSHTSLRFAELKDEIRLKATTRIPKDYVEDPPISNIPDDKRCHAKNYTCSKCHYSFTRDQKSIWYCPQCGYPRRCPRIAKTGQYSCYNHGQFFIKRGKYCVTGRREHLPRRLLESYDAAVVDKDLLLLRRDLALIESRIDDLLDRADTGESGRLWKEIKTAMRAFERADEMTAPGYLAQLKELILEGNEDYSVWGEISDLVEQRKRLVESERRRLMEMHQMISAERVMALMERIALIIEKHVIETKVRMQIGYDIKKLIENDGTVVDASVNLLPGKSRSLDDRIDRVKSTRKVIEPADD